MKRLYSILVLLLATSTLLCQSSFELSYDIKIKLNNELKDSSDHFIEEWYYELDSLTAKDLTFAQGEFDSIVLVEYSWKEKEPLIIFRGKFFDSTKVDYENRRYTPSKKKYQLIVDHLNNPNNYNWSECGSPVAEHELQFFNAGELLLRIVISCDYSQVHLSKKNSIIKYGALNEWGESSTLYKLINEIKTTTK